MRTLVSSIGLVLAIPATTLIAAFLSVRTADKAGIADGAGVPTESSGANTVTPAAPIGALTALTMVALAIGVPTAPASLAFSRQKRRFLPDAAGGLGFQLSKASPASHQADAGV